MRPRSISQQAMRRALIAEPADADLRIAIAEAHLARPRLRAHCENAPRPCPWAAGCRYGLTHEVSSAGSLITLPAGEDEELPSCCLDLGNRGGMSLEQVGAVYGVSGEAIRKIEAEALRKLRRVMPRREDLSW